MDEEDKIKREVESPIVSDGHAAQPLEVFSEEDDLNDNFGRRIDEEQYRTHPSTDTDVDSTEIYQEQDADDEHEAIYGLEGDDDEEEV